MEILRLFEDDSKSKVAGSEFEQLFENSQGEKGVRVGDVVKGTIVEVQTDYVLVDISYKSEGLIAMSEFRLVDGSPGVQPGDSLEVYVDKIENENGMVVLSKEKADMMRAWNDISRAAENQEHIEGTVISKVKGGLQVDIGVKAFLPGSQIDLRPVRNMDAYIGKVFKFKVIKFNKKRGNIVLSRRALLEEERESLRSQTKDLMKEGSKVKGMVKNLTDYGAFIDLGGIDGLLHITDMSWARIKHPSEVMNLGDEIEVLVLKYDTEKERVSLGLKQMTSDPWLETASNYPVGGQIKGKVVSLTDYGAFIEVGDGIEGLIHVSEMSWTKRVKHPSQIVTVGDEVEVAILALDQENRRISLGMKQLQPNPWNELKDAYPPGTIIEGEVKSITDFGIFIGLDGGIDGLIHLSDLSWNDTGETAVHNYKKGDELEAVVLAVDPERERISLGVKQIERDPFGQFIADNPKGSIVNGTVREVDTKHAVIDLGEGVEGVLRASEISRDRVEDVRQHFKEGDTVEAKFTGTDRKSRMLSLSIKAKDYAEEAEAMSDYSSSQAEPAGATTLGDLLKEQMGDRGADTASSDEGESGTDT